ncbi:MAG: hypothetical protein ACTSP1_09435 [Candidatus Freyarchaeota archaeon]
MFEGFLSSLGSVLVTVLILVVVVVVAYVLCVLAVYLKHDFLLYYMLRDQVRLARWLIASIINFYRYHWRFALGLFLFSGLYLLFYCALPGWTDVHTVQKHLVSLFSSTMITATAATLAKRRMKWLLRLAPITTVSTAGITAYYLYAESMYLVPQPVLPLPLELVAIAAIPAIVGAALARRLYWRIKTRRETDTAYPNLHEAASPSSTNPHHPGNPRSVYAPNRGASRIERVYGARSGEEVASRRAGGAGIRGGGPGGRPESEGRRAYRYLGRLSPKDGRGGGAGRKRGERDRDSGER